ncbi:MAG: inorganic phosphate transporter family protein [Candidatus Syntrophosphaera sp.]|nr:inorganic phosphate transporter family protein [Candidatus Syntrophosphaera sp.]
MVFFFLLSGLFLGWSLGANDTGNIFGAAVATRMIRFRQAALIAAIFLALGAILEGSGPSGTLGRLGSVDALGGAFTVSLAAALAILVIVRTGIPVSISQTIVGAILGWNYFAGRITDFGSLLTIAGSWVTAFVVSAAVAALLFYLARGWVNRSRRHLLEQDMIVRYALIGFGALGAYYLGANNIANVVGVFVPVTPFKDLAIGSLFTLTGVQQLYIAGAGSIVLGIYTYSHRVMGTVGGDIFRLSPVTALVALLSITFVLFIFTSQGLHELFLALGLPAIPQVPVSSTQVTVGAVIGIGLAKGGKNIRYNVLAKVSLAWVAAPLMAFLFSFVALFISQNVFELEVNRPLTYTVDKAAVLEIERRGIDTKNLAFVNLRSFDTERALYGELVLDDAYPPDQAREIIRVSENHPLQVKMEILDQRGLANRFSDAQLETLAKLEERKFKRRWLLARELAKDEAWKPVEDPQNRAGEAFNAALEADLAILYNVFYSPAK